MNICRVGSIKRAYFGLQISRNSSQDFKFFSENFIKGGYLKVHRALLWVPHSQYDTITFSEGYDIILSQNSNFKPYFFYNFNNDEKKYKLTFPPQTKKYSTPFSIEEIKKAFLDYRSRILNSSNK